MRKLLPMPRRPAPFLAALALAACAVNPATGRREISLVGEGQEIAIGEEAARSARASIGLYPDSALQQYVRSLGQKLAAVSERPGLPWTFEVIDDPEVNAFAAPGGKIFVTRGILPFLGSEAELAGVLGHEIGHVTARHTARQITRTQLAQVGLVAGSLLSSDFASIAGGVSAGLQVLFLSYSRGDESQSDELGFRYMRRTNYDVRELPKVFGALGRVSALSGGGRLPSWASSHPDPADREQSAIARAAQVPADSLRNAVINRDPFARAVDGIVFGADPRQGFFEGSRFLHPGLRFVFRFPDGWKTSNQADAVTGMSPGQDAIVQLALAAAESPAALLQKFGAQQGVRLGAAQQVTIGGFPAAWAEFDAQDSQGNALRGRVTFLADGATTFRFLGYATAARYGSHDGAIRAAMQSYARLTDPAALNRQPRRLRLVRLTRAMTIEEFHRQYPSPVAIELVAAINSVRPGETLPAGRWAKRVE